MKNKNFILVVLVSIIFFFLVSTTYYWESFLGILVMPSILILILVFFILLFILFRNIAFAVKEKFKVRARIILIFILITVLGLTAYKPSGIIDFDSLQGRDLLIAGAEGAANCTTTFKLKDNNKFYERSICFGISEINGEYYLSGDTIKFKNINSHSVKDSYDFAIIRTAKFYKNEFKRSLLFLEMRRIQFLNIYLLKKMSFK
ncbi:hypothetical protein FRZ67_07625 [Panacibacter ginsenosidivorans]|uniref:Uncharacterized protein n=1 Tax=Panacibacter ginsenosidivorans TaxID=1813871 RepID=A0A5B8VA40_9BACT|nr:hypothetical protein [Panacibacter ginsenosidivorans]QEC67168.1 hypothetical protein FRZ67_07625 [Panacibacter ginsenosidivorans]